MKRKIILAAVVCVLLLTNTTAALDQSEKHLSRPLYILMYHDFVPDTDAELNDWTLTESRFRQDLQWLADHGYTTVLPRELTSGEELPEKAVMLTFDDGYASNLQIALPILQEFQAKAVVAMIVERIQAGKPGFLSWDQAKTLAASPLVEIGSHTYDFHTQTIQRINGESQKDYQSRIFPDLQRSIDCLEEELETQVCYFAYPHGVTEPWADDFLREHFSVTVTTNHAVADLSNGLYDMPRHNISMRSALSDYLPS